MSILDLQEKLKKMFQTGAGVLPPVQAYKAVQTMRSPQYKQQVQQSRQAPVKVVNRVATKVGGPQFSNWYEDLIEDRKKRGIIQGMQSSFNPILMNKHVRPIAEPIVSKARVGMYDFKNNFQYTPSQRRGHEQIGNVLRNTGQRIKQAVPTPRKTLEQLQAMGKEYVAEGKRLGGQNFPGEPDAQFQPFTKEQETGVKAYYWIKDLYAMEAGGVNEAFRNATNSLLGGIKASPALSNKVATAQTALEGFANKQMARFLNKLKPTNVTFDDAVAVNRNVATPDQLTRYKQAVTVSEETGIPIKEIIAKSEQSGVRSGKIYDFIVNATDDLKRAIKATLSPEEQKLLMSGVDKVDDVKLPQISAETPPLSPIVDDVATQAQKTTPLSTKVDAQGKLYDVGDAAFIKSSGEIIAGKSGEHGRIAAQQLGEKVPEGKGLVQDLASQKQVARYQAEMGSVRVIPTAKEVNVSFVNSPNKQQLEVIRELSKNKKIVFDINDTGGNVIKSGTAETFDEFVSNVSQAGLYDVKALKAEADKLLSKPSMTKQELKRFSDIGEIIHQNDNIKFFTEQIQKARAEGNIKYVKETQPVLDKATKKVNELVAQQPLSVKSPEPGKIRLKEIEDFETQFLEEARSEFKASQQGDPQKQLFTKMRNFLRFAGENKSKQTGELFREHIPQSVFGEASDELATTMGISENELMAQLTDGLQMKGGTSPKISLPKVQKTIKSLYEKLDPEFYKVQKDMLGRVKAVSAEPSAKTVGKINLRLSDAAERTAKQEFGGWKRAIIEQEGLKTRTGAIQDLTKRMGKATKSPLAQAPEGLKDISPVQAGLRDVYRNFKQVYGKRYGDVKRLVLDPFDKSKGDFVKYMEGWDAKLNKEVVQGLGIKKGSKESAAVQHYGEGTLTEETLLKQYGNLDLNKIKKADAWFRSAYDQLLGEVNKVRTSIGYDAIPKRQDYYRHFREMRQGVDALRNIFETTAGIDPALAGISDFTKPKSKWLSFAQERIGGHTDVDAVGGFLNYLPSASYSINIDPHIGKFRALRNELVEATSDTASKESYKGLNNFIEYLNDFANDLSGKTNPLDRTVQKWIPGGRKAFRVIDWANKRVKANVILGNVASSVAQIFNVPQGMAEAGPRYWASGAGDTLASMFKKSDVMDSSNFLKERFFRSFNKYDTGMVQNTKKFAAWMITVLDEVGTKYIWNMQYRKALAEAIDNPIQYADEITRRMVAGRGIGEVPLAQSARTFQLIAPFQLEVQNLWWVMKDFVDEKAFGKLATLFALAFVFNKAAEEIRGSGVMLDPIKATLDALETYQEEDDKKIGAIKAGGRLAGEVLSNIPVGQTAASVYPEYGWKIPGTEETLTREEFFGEEDPTRFGGGALLTKGIQDPLYKLVPPFGGGQIKKTISGGKAYIEGVSKTKAGRVRFPIAKTTGNLIRSILFGQYSTPEAKQYFEAGTSPLGEKQTETYEQLSPESAKKFYDAIINKRKREKGSDKTVNSLISGRSGSVQGVLATSDDFFAESAKRSEKVGKYKEILKNPELSYEDKQTLITELGGDPVEVEYEVAAGLTVAERVRYVEWAISDLKDDEIQELLSTFRTKKTVGGSRILTDSVIDALVEKGTITKGDGNAIKAIGKKGKSAAKVTIKSTKAPTIKFTKSTAKTPTFTMPKAPSIKLTTKRGQPSLNFKSEALPTIKAKPLPKVSIAKY